MIGSEVLNVKLASREYEGKTSYKIHGSYSCCVELYHDANCPSEYYTMITIYQLTE